MAQDKDKKKKTSFSQFEGERPKMVRAANPTRSSTPTKEVKVKTEKDLLADMKKHRRSVLRMGR